MPLCRFVLNKTLIALTTLLNQKPKEIVIIIIHVVYINDMNLTVYMWFE